MPSTAAQVLVTVIPIVGIVTGGVVLFFFLYWNYKQRLLIIEKGAYRKSEFDYSTFSLFSGLVLTSIGACLVVFFVILEGFTYPVLSGLIPLSLGVSLLIFFGIKARMNKSGNGT
ncbi:MAG: hypothetical protein JW807_06695 [Spirochaetes bacterium]|nr:hypothetical protein [Spirochaetota bacterium]